MMLLGALAAAQGHSGTVKVRDVSIRVPEAVFVEQRDGRINASATLQPTPGAKVHVMSYSWWKSLLNGGPVDARRYLDTFKDTSGLKDYHLLSPLAETTFDGAPAWTFTHRYRFGIPMRDMPVKDFQEEFLVVQRRWGFVVIKYVNSPQLFAQDRPAFLALRDGIVLSPEPPGGPLLTPALAALLLAAAAAYLVLRRRRAAN